MGWYEGRSTGSGLGGHNEEVWSPPRDGAMMGMYRMIKDGQPKNFGADDRRRRVSWVGLAA